MKRKNFIKALLGASSLLTMSGFSSLMNAMANEANKEKGNLKEFATYGAIHLNNTNLQKSTQFWTKIVGMKLRKNSEKSAEFGTENKTLVVVHQTAKTKYKKGYSGLYHFAIHAPNAAEFASMMNRLNTYKYPYSPIDHTMSKSMYLDDPDGINIEFTLETPERFKRVVTAGGLKIEGTDGIIRSASDRLDVNTVMKELKDTNINKIISDESYLGHIHLYANNVAKSNDFYQQLGYIPFNNLPQFMYADLGAGGEYQHRIVMNSWHGQNKPLAPEGSAGMRHFQIDFKNDKKFIKALNNISDYKEKEGNYWLTDPTGNKIILKNKS